MTTPLSIYLDNEKLAFRGDMEMKGVIVQTICQLLDVNLDNCNDLYSNVCETRLQIVYFIDQINKKLSIPITKNVLKAITPND